MMGSNPLSTIKSLIDMPERMLSLLLMVIISWQSYTQYQVNQVVMTQLRELDKSRAEVKVELASINASLNIIVDDVKESSKDRKEMLSRIYRLESRIGIDHEVGNGQVR
jgi:hypothetical protein